MGMTRIHTPKLDNLIVPGSSSRKIYRLDAIADAPRWQSSAELRQKKRGPRRGSISRFANDDRALFDEITRALCRGVSLTAAVRMLENEKKLNGYGTPESRIRRVMRLYKKEQSERWA